MLVLSGAAPRNGVEPAQLAAGSFLRGADDRVARIAYRIATSGAPLCPEAAPVTGLAYHHLAEYEPDDRATMIARYGLDRGMGVLAVVPGSPAAQAGLRAGDVILAVNGAAVTYSAQAKSDRPNSWRAPLEAAEAQLEGALRTGPASLTVLRDGVTITRELTAVRGCPARVRLARSNQNSAFAANGYVILTTATLGLTRSDDELAVIIGHELAHVALRHPERLRAEGVPDGWLRTIGGNADRVRATEEEADRLGIRLAAAAGFDASAAIPFWRRYYARFDEPQLFRTHPSLARREQIINETLAGLQPGAQRPQFGKGALTER